MSQATTNSSTQPQSLEVDISDMHYALTREYNEPHDGFEPIPFWMTLIFAGLLSWGGWYTATYSGMYSPRIMDEPIARVGGKGGAAAKPTVDYETAPPEELIKFGARVYNNCASCHQASGEGGAGFPPLNKSEWVVGDQASPARLARILLYGLNGNISVRGKTYNGQMPAWGAQLKDEQIAAVLSYIRNNWDNKAEVIRPSVIAAARAKGAGRQMTGAQSMTQSELFGIPVDYVDPPVASAAAPAAAPAKKDGPPAAKN